MECSKSSQCRTEHYSEIVPQVVDDFFLLIAERLCIFTFRDSASLKCSFFYPIMLLTCCQLTYLVVTRFSSCFFLVHFLWLFCCTCPNFIETCCCHQIQANILYEVVKSLPFSIWYGFVCSVWRQFCLISKLLDSVFLCHYFLGILGCICRSPVVSSCLTGCCKKSHQLLQKYEKTESHMLVCTDCPQTPLVRNSRSQEHCARKCKKVKKNFSCR